MSGIILSIIMPCYNMEDTLERALDSILMQNVDFPYEIIFINDASTDKTLKIAQQYAQKYSFITIINNEINLKNAKSFFKGLCAAKGDYFCVLDGDDYYTVNDKLQRQVCFLREDIMQEYVAVTHMHLMDMGDSNVSMFDEHGVEEFNYVDFISLQVPYHHTSAYMYRNIFRDKVPAVYNEDVFRGDTPRTLFHLMYSNKKIKIFRFVGSAYYYSYKGIWSGMDVQKQSDHQIAYYLNLFPLMVSSYEKSIVGNLLDFYEERKAQNQGTKRSYTEQSVDLCLEQIRNLAGRYAFWQSDFVFNGCYYSEYIDSICASLGYVYRVQHPEKIQTQTDPNSICIVNGILNPKGGGIFKEIQELLSFYPDKKITVLVTNMETVPPEATSVLESFGNVKVICPPKTEDKLGYLHEALIKASPSKAYYYASHNDTFGQALMQKGPCKNITLFSFDHGFLCGITNPNIDCIIAKRPVDYAMLKEKLGDKVIYIPTWGESQKSSQFSYRPFKEHDNLITASGAARFYKLDGVGELSYIDRIVELLSKTGGKHYHLGEISKDKMAQIYTRLLQSGVPKDSFIPLGWVSQPAEELLKLGVDVFIEPFPVVSYKLTLEMYAAGIPVIVYDGYTRMSITDFAPEGILSWRTAEEFVDKLTAVDSSSLQQQSKLVKEYFASVHDSDVVRPYFTKEKCFLLPQVFGAVDAQMHDVYYYKQVFEYKDYKIAEEKEAREEEEHKIQNLTKEIEMAKKSVSYRLGSFLTWLPRKLSSKKSAVEGEVAINVDTRTSSDELAIELQTIRQSKSMAVGHFITAPLRWAKRVL